MKTQPKSTCLLAATAALLLASPSVAQSIATPADKNIGKIGTGVAIALPIAAAGITLLHDRDWEGLGQLGLSTGLTVGTALILKQIVRERRPDHSDFQSFPSDTSALASSAADYLWDRYGWRYGLPALAAATFVGYSRVRAKKHHWYDVAASSALAFGINYAFVTRYRENRNYGVYASTDGDSIGVRFAMNW